MKELNKLEKVVPVPDTTFYGAYYYNGEDINLCNDEENLKDKEESTYIRVTDKIINGILYKEKILDVTLRDGKHIKEETKKELPLKKGDMLIYVMYEGFVQTRTKLITIDEAVERLKILKSPEKEN